ncbi:hypothetical protein F8388_018303 [Cannabis sativa]|uniref:WIYLD domain-containing protein n=1 Tax=Cannabis sativa TaxID=3483 RepID=A0A7J6EL29_CANSA|nr:hypothetical protein F8388_018303 [Cannabis sativa]
MVTKHTQIGLFLSSEKKKRVLFLTLVFDRLKRLGIEEGKVKRVLKKLFKLYDKNWELIEEENYRALADAIFEEDDTIEEEKKKGSDHNAVNVYWEKALYLLRTPPKAQGMITSQSCASSSDGSMASPPAKFSKLPEQKTKDAKSVVVELEAHAVMDLVVLESDMVFVDVVPLLNSNLISSGSGLSRHQLL